MCRYRILIEYVSDDFRFNDVAVAGDILSEKIIIFTQRNIFHTEPFTDSQQKQDASWEKQDERW